MRRQYRSSLYKTVDRVRWRPYDAVLILRVKSLVLQTLHNKIGHGGMIAQVTQDLNVRLGFVRYES